MSEFSTFERLRPLGLLEQFSSARHSLGFYRNVAVTASYSTLVSRPRLMNIIYRALGTVIARHPVLSAIVVDEDTPAPYFVRLPQINLESCVTFITRKREYNANNSTDNELDAILEDQHNTNFKEKYGERPFWRFVILTEAGDSSHFGASFIFHHSLGDGASGLAFHRTFLSALSGTHGAELAEAASETIIECPKQPLIPSLESLHPLPLSTFYILKALWNSWFPTSQEALWTALPMTEDVSKRRARFRSFVLPQSTTQNLLVNSRTHDATLTAAIEVLLADVLFKNLPSQYSNLRGAVPISLRRVLPSEIVDDDSIGTWISACVHDHSRLSQQNEEEFFSWGDVQRVRRTINAEVGKEGKDTAVGLLRYAGIIRDHLIGRIGKHREESFEISNVGVFKASPNSLWKVGRMVFSQSANVVGPPLVACLVTGGDGCLDVGFSWLEGIVDEKLMEKVIVDLKGGLEKLAKDVVKV